MLYKATGTINNDAPSGHHPGRRPTRHAHILQIGLHLTQPRTTIAFYGGSHHFVNHSVSDNVPESISTSASNTISTPLLVINENSRDFSPLLLCHRGTASPCIFSLSADFHCGELIDQHDLPAAIVSPLRLGSSIRQQNRFVDFRLVAMLRPVVLYESLFLPDAIWIDNVTIMHYSVL